MSSVFWMALRIGSTGMEMIIAVKPSKWRRKDDCPEDVNLIDVIEMICDCVCAGMARSGNVYPIEISPEILQKAIQNTVQMCIDAVEVETEDE